MIDLGESVFDTVLAATPGMLAIPSSRAAAFESTMSCVSVSFAIFGSLSLRQHPLPPARPRHGQIASGVQERAALAAPAIHTGMLRSDTKSSPIVGTGRERCLEAPGLDLPLSRRNRGSLRSARNINRLAQNLVLSHTVVSKFKTELSDAPRIRRTDVSDSRSPAVEQLLTTGPLNRDETSSARRCESRRDASAQSSPAARSSSHR